MGWLSNLWSHAKEGFGKALDFGGKVLRHAGEWGGRIARLAGEWAPVASDLVSGISIGLGQPEVALAAQGVANIVQRISNAATPVADNLMGFGNSLQSASQNLIGGVG